MSKRKPWVLAVLFISAVTPSCKKAVNEAPSGTEEDALDQAESPVELTQDELDMFEPLSVRMDKEGAAPPSEAMIDLGRMLYYEARLSKNHDISCNSCHGLDNFGVDGEKTSPGHKGARGDRNSPTVYNAGQHIAQFWDGRAADLEEQAKGPILNPVEMAMASEAVVVKTLRSIPGYIAAFKKAYPKAKKAITYDNMAIAIGAFERGLVTPGPFDRFLEGDKDALTDTQKAGLKRFASIGCTTCHNGAAVGGTSFQKLGLVKPYEDEDLGRFKVTNEASDKQKFRVPSLRNITKTGPYFHHGKYTDLHAVVRTMGRHQLGLELDDQAVGELVSFLDALTGELPTDYIAKPELPKSGPKTPKPDPS